MTGLDPGDVLAVEVDDQPQHAVRRRVVRPEVDREDVVEVVLVRVDPRGSSGSGAGMRVPS